jgi:DNA-binding NarL/FixJ family response regulator
MPLSTTQDGPPLEPGFPMVSAAGKDSKLYATATLPRPSLSPAGHSHGTIRILLADDHRVFREGLSEFLADQPGLEIVGQAADGQAAVDLAMTLHPDVVLMDVTMPRMSGIEATRRILSKMPGVPVIGLSMHVEDDMAVAMRDAGAVAYLTKSGSSDHLVEAIHRAVE